MDENKLQQSAGGGHLDSYTLVDTRSASVYPYGII